MEINGWAVIRGSYIWNDAEDWLSTVVMKDIEARVSEPAFNEMVELQSLNNTLVLHVAVQRNRYLENSDNIIDLFRYIAQVAPGSYGQLHINDDEGRYGDANTMFVLVLARGELARRKDPFFTPYIPNVEGPDPYATLRPLSDRIPKYLPLGSVVVLNNGEKKLMIFGRCQKDTANDRVFDYVGVPYPEGNIMAKATFLFNHEDIAWIHYLGFADEEEEAWADKLKAVSSRSNSPG
jgi:hypothetical protein